MFLQLTQIVTIYDTTFAHTLFHFLYNLHLSMLSRDKTSYFWVINFLFKPFSEKIIQLENALPTPDLIPFYLNVKTNRKFLLKIYM